jgi:DNA-directed RNA polymerase subunit beta'
MAVHLPLSRRAVLEARRLMLSTYNMLSPSSGEPIVAPTLDIVLGCFYMTMIDEDAPGTGRRFASFGDAQLAYDMGIIDMRALIKIGRVSEENGAGPLETTVGRIIFNEVLPESLGYHNEEMDKARLKDVTAQCYQKLGSEGTSEVLDAIKVLGFHYACKSGITIAINDVEVSPKKGAIVGGAESKIELLEQQYLDGLITEDERYANAVQIWTDANDSLTKVIESTLRNYGGIYLMATSGAKGNIAQIKQMAGMRGLMSDPKGRIIDRPIKSNFREGLSVLEYFISTHGARKGLADTALRTADSGYLTRRLIDVSQEVIVLEQDCETTAGIWIVQAPTDAMVTPFNERLRGRYASEPVADPATGEILVDRNEEFNAEAIVKLQEANVPGALARSSLVCEAQRGVCRLCYGISLGTMQLVTLGEAVGIIAAQSIGEPGTQLTMRTFHTGGIAGADITSGLPRVEELFEARAPKGEAVLSEIDGVVEVADASEGRVVRVVSTEEYSDEYPLPSGYSPTVSDGDFVTVGQNMAETDEPADEESSALKPAELVARVSGTVRVTDDMLSITWTDEEPREYIIPAAAHIVAKTGDSISAGEALTGGPKSPQQILRIQGREAVERYMVEEVQRVYRSQGVTIHDKHIEVIIGQMLRKVRIDAPGDTELLPGELVERQKYEDMNASILAEGGEPATASPVLLGITKASLNMDSFLAAASFQETTRVLAESAVNSDVDPLLGLKENVIIGRLIPARFDLSEEGRKRLGLDEPATEPVGIFAGAPEESMPFALDDAIEETPSDD